MVGAAVRGLSKILRKTGKKRPKRGTPIAAGMVQRRAMLRGLSDPKKKSHLEKIKQPKAEWAKQTKAPKKPGYIEGVATGAAATTATALYLGNKKARKEAQAKEDKKLKKAIDKKKAKDKKKKEAYGKRAPKKDKNYGGR